MADIWNNGTRTLSEALLGNGDKLATNSYIDTATSTIITEVLANRTLINNLNNISATDVWNSASRSLTDYSTSTIASSVWDRATSTLSTLGSVGKHLVDNLDAQVSSRGTSTLTAADIWNAGTRSLTDYSTSSVALAVWNNAARTLTSYGNDITAADVWNVLSGSLTLDNSIGKQLATNIDSTVSSRASQASITALNNISASDVWSYANRSITDPASVWDYATTLIGTNGSVGKLIKDNLDAQVSSRSSHTAADVWNVVGRTLTSNANFNDPSSATIASAVWSQATRDLTSYGNDITAADVWNVLSANLTTNGTVGKQLATNIDATVSSRSTLTAANVWEYANRTLSSFGTLVADIWNNGTRTLSEALWTVSTSDFGTITAGSNYLATVTTIYNGTLTDSLNVPTVTVYDPGRNVIVNSVAMTRTATGTYSYSYTTASNAPAGTWESVFSATVGIGKTLTGNDYWSVAVSPPQVIINSISDNTIPTISANVTITNEGLTGYEYQYEWCVVSSVNNACGGGDDVFHSTAAKFINPGEDWNTNLTANVSTIGNYYFKVIVYFGTDNSGASRSFTAQAEVITPPAGGGGGGSGGGNNSVVPTPSTTPINSVCNDADFNNDKKVNSVDFSILLAFWKTSWPFRNKCVDINSDKQVNSVDFSILMYQWGSKK